MAPRDADGWRRILRLDLNARGTAVTQATPIEASVPAADRAFVTVSDDDLVYLVTGANTPAGDPAPEPSSGPAEFSAFRVRLR